MYTAPPTRAARPRAHVRSITPIGRIACAAKYRGYRTHAFLHGETGLHLHRNCVLQVVVVVVVGTLSSRVERCCADTSPPRRAERPSSLLLPPPRSSLRASGEPPDPLNRRRLMRALFRFNAPPPPSPSQSRRSFYRTLVNPGV